MAYRRLLNPSVLTDYYDPFCPLLALFMAT